MPVILFHAGFSTFGGGYVGVDVFFVISGYLITTIIVNELDDGRFSLWRFYERRARRILPALFLVMLCSVPFAWFWLTPFDLQEFGRSLAAVATFSSNVLFWIESDYFGTAAELKPMLHTWSLAVEEQYYILFPVFLLMIWRFGRRWLVPMITLMFVVSLGMAQWGAYHMPDATFFLLPMRGWEILLGVLVAIWLRRGGVIVPSAVAQVLSLLGLAMIIYAIISFDADTPFPSLFALVPTIGTVLLIICAVEGTLVNRLLCMKPIVAIGLVSYSAYLWHQPAFAFARHRTGGEVDKAVLIALGVVSIGLAWVSWRFVERPFRSNTGITRRCLVTGAIACSLAFIVVGAAAHTTRGFERLKLSYEYTDAERHNYKMIKQSTDYDKYARMINEKCHLWVRNTRYLDMDVFSECARSHGAAVVVLGDSHAANLYGIIAKSGHLPFVVGVSQGNCRPHDPGIDCHYGEFIEFLATVGLHVRRVVFHQSGSYLIRGSNGEYEPSFHDNKISFDKGNVIRIVEYLRAIESMGVEAVWLGPFIESRLRPENQLRRVKNIPAINFEVFRQLEAEISEVLAEEEFARYAPFEALYIVPETPVVGDCYLWYDGDHFSSCGESLIASSPRLRHWLFAALVD